MREIKFRAWDKENKKMLTQNPFDSFHYALTFEGTIYREGKIKDWILLQYTGLKDSDGKEIYEGDVVMAPTFSAGQMHKALVKYETDRFRLIPYLKKGYKKGRMLFYKSCYGNKKCKIIGNIYENSELVS